MRALFDYLENGESLDDFLEGFPTVSRDMAIQILEEVNGTSPGARLMRIAA